MDLRKTILFVLLASVVCIAADQSLSVAQLVSFIRSSVKMHYADKELADYLHHVKLTNRLDDRTIEELQGEGGLGPRTMTALKELRDSSSALTAPPAAKATPRVTPPPQEPPPDSVEQGKVLAEARGWALNYTKQLPNFLCLEAVRRSIDRNLKDPPGEEVWEGQDNFVTRLSYFEQKEDYKVIMVGNRSVQDKDLLSMGGAISQGEFGSMMREIFDPESEARFDWDHWGKLRGRIMYVFSYDIDQPHSKYSITWDRSDRIVPAYRGKVYIDKDLHTVMRITQEPYDIPASFPVRDVQSTLDYEFQKIGDSEFLVPLKVLVYSRTTHYLSKNEIEFRLYKRFGADSSIKFEELGPAIPEEKLKDEKPKAKQ